jgi:creatinine amidohydrolase/Fe(II)-dependent formamide hydrolase-like protein
VLLVHDEWTPSGVIGNPLTATPRKGEIAIEHHLVDAIHEIERVPITIHNRGWADKV